jgi:elongator complex protein 5
MKYCSTLIGVYHRDTIPSTPTASTYAPAPLDLFKYLATTIITVKSLAHVLAAKAARTRSLPEPTHGLLQSAEGVIQCLNANDTRGIVLSAEFRRKSGRSESENYFLRPSRASDYNAALPGMAVGTLKKEFVVLLDQVPAYANGAVIGLVGAGADDGVDKDQMESTFKLGLTDKQRAVREEVVMRRRTWGMRVKAVGFFTIWGVRMILTRRRMRSRELEWGDRSVGLGQPERQLLLRT